MDIKPNVKNPDAVITLTSDEVKNLSCQITDVIEHSVYSGQKNLANTATIQKFNEMLDHFLVTWGGWTAEEE